MNLFQSKEVRQVVEEVFPEESEETKKQMEQYIKGDEIVVSISEGPEDTQMLRESYPPLPLECEC